MDIVAARIKGFRTVKDELDLNLGRGLTLVGPNNSGKTNVLKSIRYFFTGYDNQLNYRRDSDLSINQSKIQSSVALTFRGDPNGADKEIYEHLDSIRSLLTLPARDQDDFTVYLTFSVNDKAIYRVFPNLKRPTQANTKAQYSRYERKLISTVLERFSVHYIPSDKSTSQLYQDLVLPFLLRKSFSAIYPHLKHIQDAMQEAANTLNMSLRAAGLESLVCSFRFPTDPERMFRDVDFSISDPNYTSIFAKGMGIQSAALLAAFNWITEQEVSGGKSVLWLLEEPESYLHPELAHHCENILAELRTKSQVVSTTHALSFVPQDPGLVVGISLEEGWTKAKKFKTYQEATMRIRKSLGVRFSDFYNMNIFNVLVEGPTDRDYMNFIIEKVLRVGEISRDFPIICSKHTSFLDQGGVSGLQSFVRATYEFIRNERPCFIMLDGDEAGQKCKREMQAFLSNKNVSIEANRHFVIVRDRHPVEGLFPDEWVEKIHEAQPGWFSDYSKDAQGALLPFKLKDDHKRHFFDAVVAMASAEEDTAWADKWICVARVIEEGLRKEGERIYGRDELSALLAAEEHKDAENSPFAERMADADAAEQEETDDEQDDDDSALADFLD